MSQLPLSLMNRLNKTESAVFILWMLYFHRISFQIILFFFFFFSSTAHFRVVVLVLFELCMVSWFMMALVTTLFIMALFYPSWSTKAQIDMLFSPWPHELHFPD